MPLQQPSDRARDTLNVHVLEPPTGRVWITMPAPMSANAFPHLHGHAYMALTTYRKSGAPVSTPVWFAQVDNRVYMITEPTAGKLKRLRNNPKVDVAPSSVRGKPVGPSAPALARELTVEAERQAADAALSKKYGIQKTLFQLLWKVQRITPAFIEISPA